MLTMGGMAGKTTHLELQRADDLEAWEPIDGHAIVTCKVDLGRGKWEDRTYELESSRTGGWVVYPGGGPGGMRRDTWLHVVHWFRSMRPIDIELVTTV